MQQRFENITGQAGQATPQRFTCPTTLLNKGELHCDDSAQNITCRVGQVGVLFCLRDCHFLPNLFATCNGASGYVARCLIYGFAGEISRIRLVLAAAGMNRLTH